MLFSANEAYLRPARKRPNLTIRTNALVTKVIVERGRAVGVEVTDGKHGRERIHAGSEVILAAGAFNTPALLQHSGIGPPISCARSASNRSPTSPLSAST